MFRSGVALALATALLWPAGALGAQTQAGSPSARTEIQNLVRAYVEAHNKADATALMDMVKRAPDVTSVSDGEIARGWEAIRTDTDQLTGSEGSFRLSIGTMDVNMLGAGYALVVAPTTVIVATPQGGAQVRGAVTIVLERTSGGWKIVNEHFSTKPQR